MNLVINTSKRNMNALKHFESFGPTKSHDLKCSFPTSTDEPTCEYIEILKAYKSL